MKRDDKLAPQHTNFDTLMRQLCVGWGLCGSLQHGRFVHVTDLLPKSGMVSATLFVECVMLAEGEADIMGPWVMGMRERIATAFVAHMESEEVDVSRLRYLTEMPSGDRVQAHNQVMDIKRGASLKGKLQ